MSSPRVGRAIGKTQSYQDLDVQRRGMWGLCSDHPVPVTCVAGAPRGPTHTVLEHLGVPEACSQAALGPETSACPMLRAQLCSDDPGCRGCSSPLLLQELEKQEVSPLDSSVGPRCTQWARNLGKCASQTPSTALQSMEWIWPRDRSKYLTPIHATFQPGHLLTFAFYHGLYAGAPKPSHMLALSSEHQHPINAD